MYLFLAFLLVPLVEIALFIQVGGLLGLWPTLGIVILTAILGTALVRSQGADAIARVRRSVDELSDPSEPIAHGALILFSGALLLTPGFFTDAVGFALLTPGVRKKVIDWGRKRIRVARTEGGARMQFGGRAGPQHRPGQGFGAGHRPGARPGQTRGDVIEGEYRDITDPTDETTPQDDPPRRDPNRPASGWTRH